MTLYLTRAGKYGEHEDTFLEEGFISICWQGDAGDGFQSHDLTNIDREKLREVLEICYPDASIGRRRNWLGQIIIPALTMQRSDFVVMPFKNKPAVAIGKVISDYEYHPKALEPHKHQRKIEWLKTIQRHNFKQDLLYSFGAFMTFCKIERNNAEQRIEDILEKGKDSSIFNDPLSTNTLEDNTATDASGIANLGEIASDQLTQFIETNFKGDTLEILVEEIFKAQGYFTYRSPRGADKGVDVLAAKGALGFESPKICIQVKSGGEVSRPVINELQGTMQTVGADYGLIVSWDGFKNTIEKEERQNRFFNIRLWNSQDLVNQIQQHYDQFSDELKADLPLKRLWVLTDPKE